MFWPISHKEPVHEWKHTLSSMQTKLNFIEWLFSMVINSSPDPVVQGYSHSSTVTAGRNPSTGRKIYHCPSSIKIPLFSTRPSRSLFKFLHSFKARELVNQFITWLKRCNRTHTLLMSKFWADINFFIFLLTTGSQKAQGISVDRT